MKKILGIPATVALLASVSAWAQPTGPISRQLSFVPGLALGDSVPAFMGLFSSAERDTNVKGLRIFDVKENTLPDGVSRIRCDFVDGRLVYLEVGLVRDASSWSSTISLPILAYGVPDDWSQRLEAGRLHVATPTETAGWSDGTTTLIYGRDGDEFTVALLDAAFLQALASIAKTLPVRSAHRAMEPKASGGTDSGEADYQPLRRGLLPLDVHLNAPDLKQAVTPEKVSDAAMLVTGIALVAAAAIGVGIFLAVGTPSSTTTGSGTLHW